MKVLEYTCGDCWVANSLKSTCVERFYTHEELLLQHMIPQHCGGVAAAAALQQNHYYYCPKCVPGCTVFSDRENFITHLMGEDYDRHHWHKFTREQIELSLQYAYWPFDGIFFCDRCHLWESDWGDRGEEFQWHRQGSGWKKMYPNYSCEKFYYIDVPLPGLEFPLKCTICKEYYARSEKTLLFHQHFSCSATRKLPLRICVANYHAATI